MPLLLDPPLDEEGYGDFTRAVVADDEVCFPAYAYAFIMGHTRDFAGWVYYSILIAKDPDKRRVWRRVEVAKLFQALFDVTEQGAYLILRRGNGYFWKFEKGESIIEILEPREIHALIKANSLLAWIPVELIAVPLAAFTNLLRLRSHMSFRAQSKDLYGETLTPMAYTARLSRVKVNAARRYRHLLRRAKYLKIQRNYCFYIKPSGTDPHKAEFPALRNPKETCRRLPDTVIFDTAKVIDPNREGLGSKSNGGAEGFYREDILTYIFSDRYGIPTRPPEAVSRPRGAKRRWRKRPLDFTRYRFISKVTRLLSWYPDCKALPPPKWVLYPPPLPREFGKRLETLRASFVLSQKMVRRAVRPRLETLAEINENFMV